MRTLKLLRSFIFSNIDMNNTQMFTLKNNSNYSIQKNVSLTDINVDMMTVTLIDVFLFIFACLLAAFICIGNITAIISIWLTPSLRSLPNLYVASLACADFIVGLGCLLLALFLLPPTRSRLFFRYIHVCVLMQGLNLGMCAVSVLHMTLISVDRFLYITQPYLYERIVKLKPAVITLGAIWSFGFMYSLLPHFIYNPYMDPPVCDVTLVMPIGYLFYSSCTIYFSLVLVIVVMYSFILRTAYVQQKAVGTATVYTDGDKERRFSTRKSAWKSVKFFIVVFGVFFVCFTPVVACLGIDYFYNVPGELYRFLNLVAIMNSGMNFVIFAVLKKQFRQTFLRLLGLGVCLKKESDSQVLPFPTVVSTSFHN